MESIQNMVKLEEYEEDDKTNSLQMSSKHVQPFESSKRKRKKLSTEKQPKSKVSKEDQTEPAITQETADPSTSVKPVSNYIINPSVTVEEVPLEFNPEVYMADLNQRMQAEMEELDERTRVYICPKHPTYLLEFNIIETRYGPWEYYKCPQKDCLVCCGADKVANYQEQFEKQVAQFWLKNLEYKNKCFCRNPLILKISKSEKNPGRMYFGCRKKKCDFFNWADKNPSDKMARWINEEAEKPKPQRKVEDPEKEVTVEDKKSVWRGKQPLKEFKPTPQQDIDMRLTDIKDPQTAAYWKKVRMNNEDYMVKRVDRSCPEGDDLRVFTQIPDPGAERYPPPCVQKGGPIKYRASHNRSDPN